MPLKAAWLAVPLAGIGQRLTSDVTSGRRDDRYEAAASVTAREGAGLEDVVIKDGRPIRVVARERMTFPGWLWAAGRTPGLPVRPLQVRSSVP